MSRRRSSKSSKLRRTCIGAVILLFMLFPVFSPFLLNTNLLYLDLSVSTLDAADWVGTNRTSITNVRDAKDRLQAYDPRRAPVFPNIIQQNPIPTKTVGLVTISPLVGEAMHFLYDGVKRSNYLHLIGTISLYDPNATDVKNQPPIHFQPSDADLWIIDGGRVAKLNRDFLTQLIQTKQASWKVLIVDFTDRFPFQLRHYYKHDIWNHPHVRLAIRSITTDRNYNAKEHSMDRGRIADSRPTAGGPTLHAPYAVRSDTVQAVELALQLPNSDLSTMAKAILEKSRPMDVVHMWDLEWKTGKSRYRNDISLLVRAWNGTTTKTGTPLRTSISEQGERRRVGRNSVDVNYVQALLSAKIVVVTQKDDWEDHYRLFESLACGALVMHDTMLAPPKGLVSGENLLFFDNSTHLEQLVMYYLEHEQERKAVARKGWEVAMGRHRSWHRIEELVFGRPLTDVAPAYAN